jgi:hypothetical protein
MPPHYLLSQIVTTLEMFFPLEDRRAIYERARMYVYPPPGQDANQEPPGQA